MTKRSLFTVYASLPYSLRGAMTGLQSRGQQHSWSQRSSGLFVNINNDDDNTVCPFFDPRFNVCIVFSCWAIIRIEGCLNSAL